MNSLFAMPSTQLAGAGEINTHGLVSDQNLTFDSTHGLTQRLTYGDVNVNLDLTDISGIGAGRLGVGYAGAAALTIRGITVNSSAGYMGYGAGSTGLATVDGTNSVWATNSISVGSKGSGTLMIVNGGTVNSGHSVLGSSGGTGTVTVSGDGSTWNASNFNIFGTGILNVANGGAVNSDSGYIGYIPGYEGTATVSGNGSTWTNSGDLYVGYYGDGQLRIASGGSVTVGGVTTVGYSSSVYGSIHLNNGTLTTQSLLATGNYSMLSGTGTINTRGLVSDTNLTFDSTANHTFTITDNVTVNLNMSDSSNVGDLGVGFWNATGSLVISNGVTVHAANGYLGFQPGSSGTATVIDGSTWNNKANLYVGYRGNGTLLIQNGANVSAAGTTVVGSPTTGGVGAIKFAGTGGTLSTKELDMLSGTASVSGAGTVIARGVVGDVDMVFDGSTTTTIYGSVTLNLDMSDSANVGNMGIGYAGNGTLTIRNGATIYSAIGRLGDQTGSSGTATVDGANSEWNIAGNLYVGGYSDDHSHRGYGALNITGGAAVTNATGYVGDDMFTMGVVTVDGSGSTWTNTSGVINVANFFRNSGTLNVSNDSTVVANAINSGQFGSVGGTMTLNFNGGILKANVADNPDWITLGVGGVYVQDRGAKFDTNGYNMGIAVPLTTGSTATDGGIAKLGAGTLTLSGVNTYTGATTVKAGALVLAGTNTDTPIAWAPVLNAGGADVQAGKLVFNYAGGTSPADTIAQILDDSFGTSNPFSQGNGAQIYSTTADVANRAIGWIDDGVDEVTVMYTLYGDSNLDGSVNGTDLNAVLSYYNQSGQVWACGDFNYDGSVNGTDLNTVLSNYNQSLSSSTAAVPEPSTLLLMVLGLVGLLAVRRVRACTHR